MRIRPWGKEKSPQNRPDGIAPQPEVKLSELKGLQSASFPPRTATFVCVCVCMYVCAQSSCLVMAPLPLCQVVSCPGVPLSSGTEPWEYFSIEDKQLSPLALTPLFLHPSVLVPQPPALGTPTDLSR